MPNMGRPTDNPKPYRVSARIDKETKAILDIYCERFNVSQGDAVRHGISLLNHEIKK